MMQKTQEFDFKPFFDLIVGMLFVLIIMVSAELVFQQYNPANEDDKQQQVFFEQEVLSFLKKAQASLKEKNITSNIDVTNRILSLDIAPFVENPHSLKAVRSFFTSIQDYTLLKMQRVSLLAAVSDLKGVVANDVGEALITTLIYKNDPTLFNLQNDQQHKMILVNKQNTLQKEGILTIKFDIILQKGLGKK